MENTSFIKRPWVYIVIWLVILMAAYGVQIWRMGGVQASLWAILFDLVCVFPVLLILWMAFFAQFVLPVRTFGDRQKVFTRLLLDLFRLHGPALFIENGEVKEHSGERLKKGHGVVWLDSASAAVTRTPVAIKQVLGPGVHFIEKGETIAGTLDLHIQTQSLGPEDGENPFAEKTENQSEEEYKQIQDRRKTVSAWTRDGIEVVPTISISFRVDTGFPREDEPGSRFGYRTGITRKAKENEEKDRDAIRRAILGEGVNPHMDSERVRRRVAWNELPASLAVDVWREYVTKFTLDDLFNPEQTIPPAPPPPPQPADEEIDPLSQPVQVPANQTRMEDRFARFLRKINVVLSKSIGWLEGEPNKGVTSRPAISRSGKSGLPEISKAGKGTALQVINEMINARLKNPEAAVLDDQGVRGSGSMFCQEYQLLKRRGIVVRSVSVTNIRFQTGIEEKIIEKWHASWLKNAEAEKKQIELRQNIKRTNAQETAHQQYADLLSNDLLRKKPNDIPGALRVLLLRTNKIITNNDQIRKNMSEGQLIVEDILRWIEETE